MVKVIFIIVLLTQSVIFAQQRVDGVFDAERLITNDSVETGLKILEKIRGTGLMDVDGYILLGKTYDLIQKPVTAIGILYEGLKKFPNEGALYLEAGRIKFMNHEIESALSFWEDGILADPDFPENYLSAAKLFLLSEEPLWAVIYSEIFLNLNKDPKINAIAGNIFTDAHRSSINIISDSVIKISFSQNAYFRNGVFTTHTFESFYENVFLYALAGLGDTLNLTVLLNARVKFVEIWQREAMNKFSNPLFSYHKLLLNNGLLEAYNYFLIKDSFPKEFENWLNLNRGYFNRFMEFRSNNPISVYSGNPFNRFILN